jgi:hypothetical protein
VSCPGRSLPPRERPGTHCTGGWVGPRAGLDRWGKISPPPTGFDPWTVQPVASRYTDYATRPTCVCMPVCNHVTLRNLFNGTDILCDYENTVTGSFNKWLAYFKINFLKILKYIRFYKNIVYVNPSIFCTSLWT